MANAGHLVTALQAARILGTSRRTVLRMAQSGELPHVHKLTGRAGAYLFDSAVVEMLARQKEKAAS